MALLSLSKPNVRKRMIPVTTHRSMAFNFAAMPWEIFGSTKVDNRHATQYSVFPFLLFSTILFVISNTQFSLYRSSIVYSRSDKIDSSGDDSAGCQMIGATLAFIPVLGEHENMPLRICHSNRRFPTLPAFTIFLLNHFKRTGMSVLPLPRTRN